MEDRYIELRELAQENKAWEGTPKRVSVSEDILKVFQEKARNVQNGIDFFTKLNEELKGLEAEAKKITTADQEKAVNEKVLYSVNKAKEAAEQTKQVLDLLGKEAEKNKQEFPKEPETRAMVAQLRGLTSKFSSVLKENQKMQASIQGQVRERIRRQVRIIDNKLSPEEVDAISEDPNAFQQLMEVKTLGKAHLKLYYHVEDIMEKYEGILKLERSIEYILRLINDIAFLVEEQGEMLDSIEKDLEKAENYVKKANRVLEQEQKDHKKRRARYCCILLIIIAIAAAVSIPVINAVKG